MSKATQSPLIRTYILLHLVSLNKYTVNAVFNIEMTHGIGYRLLNSVKFKISFMAFLVISVFMIFFTIRDMTQTEDKLLNSQKEKAVLLSERISHGIMVLMLNNRWQDLQAFMENLTKDSNELRGIRIFLPESGLIVASSDPDTIGQKTTDHDIAILKTHEKDSAFLIDLGGQRYASKLTAIENLPACHRCHGSSKETLGVMGIELSLAKIDKLIREFKKEHFFDSLIVSLLIGAGIILAISRLIESPIEKMIRVIRKIEDGDLTARMEDNKKDEFGVMAKSFNNMLESLDTAKKELEMYNVEQMRRAAKMASLGEIISSIAHEIKNPLTGISLAIQVFHSELSDDDSRKAVTREVLLQIDRLDRTVKGLLNYAKPKPPHFSALSINSVLDRAIFFVYPEAKKENVTINIKTEKNVPDVMVDSDLMQQVFLNLIINAIQAMHGGGRLKITISKTEKYAIQEDRIRNQLVGDTAVIIKFTDTGKGIENKQVKNIFEPFYTKKSKGTGLGLSISHRIVHEHGGEIAVDSVPDKGSSFTVFLPASKIKVTSV
jgi:signal transduction histidine kinase